MSSGDTEALAEGLAADGQEELLKRFREAYARALGTHADLVSVDSERVEALVQHSAAEADGLQWRRALAGVAASHLGLELGAALTHPVVERAHELTGAPSYESALAALAAPAPLLRPAPPEVPVAEPEPVVAPAPVTKPEAVVAPAPVAEPEPVVAPAPVIEPEAVVAPAPVAEPEPVVAPAPAAEFDAIHLGGVTSLPSGEQIALRLSAEGLDLLGNDGTIVGRLGWSDIAALEVTVPHGRRRRRNAPRLVVHTAEGSASFEAADLSGEELQEQVQPLMARFGR